MGNLNYTEDWRLEVKPATSIYHISSVDDIFDILEWKETWDQSEWQKWIQSLHDTLAWWIIKVGDNLIDVDDSSEMIRDWRHLSSNLKSGVDLFIDKLTDYFNVLDSIDRISWLGILSDIADKWTNFQILRLYFAIDSLENQEVREFLFWRFALSLLSSKRAYFWFLETRPEYFESIIRSNHFSFERDIFRLPIHLVISYLPKMKEEDRQKVFDYLSTFNFLWGDGMEEAVLKVPDENSSDTFYSRLLTSDQLKILEEYKKTTSNQEDSSN